MYSQISPLKKCVNKPGKKSPAFDSLIFVHDWLWRQMIVSPPLPRIMPADADGIKSLTSKVSSSAT